jgi:hypothetical protein
MGQSGGQAHFQIGVRLAQPLQGGGQDGGHRRVHRPDPQAARIVVAA